MCQKIYLDTNAFRYFGQAFQEVSLPENLKDRILISPLSAFEVFAQLANQDDGEKVLFQIRAIRNWTNLQSCGLLPWPDEMLCQLWFRKTIRDENFTRQIEHSFNACLSASSVAVLKKESEEFKQVMDKFKLDIAQDFKNMIDAARNKRIKSFDVTNAWFLGIAKRVNAESSSERMPDLISALSAYHEFEESKFTTALVNPKYNPLSKKNRNDIVDSEQLIYLGDESLCMLTSDRGIQRKVTKSKQAARIIWTEMNDLIDARKAEAVVRRAIFAKP
jgi:hypothetical protein